MDAALEVFEDMGAIVEEITIPSLEYAGASQPVIMLSEAFAYHQANLRSRPDEYGEMVRARFRVGGMFGSGDYVQAQRVRGVIKREFAEAMRHYDVIVSPTSSTQPPRFDAVERFGVPRGPSFTGPYNLTGMPAISINCGFTSAGLPVGLQIAGKPFDEPTVLRAAYTYEQRARWFDRRPPV